MYMLLHDFKIFCVLQQLHVAIRGEISVLSPFKPTDQMNFRAIKRFYTSFADRNIACDDISNVMSPTIGFGGNFEMNRNGFAFSECSVDAFQAYIDSLTA